MHVKIVLLFICVHCTWANFSFEKNLMKTWKNNTFYAFRGIKYAESPTGALRFKAPKPVKTWGNLTALFEQDLTKDGSDCPSPNTSYNEDCLYLNVYTKNVNESTLKPVIVFIHPGGFYVGSGSSAQFGPKYLLEEDLVLVTFNYRLAFFGFTSTGTGEAIGNAGFKDQALVLKWVHDHIRHFGGDPNYVTLMGDSAGGMSVTLHLVSPLSRHLFHRAFALSGGILPQSKSPSSQPHLFLKLARLIGCPANQSAFECVKQADTVTITDCLRKIFDFGWDNPVYPWLPIVEPNNSDEFPFLVEDPMRLLETGKFNAIPTMVSITKDEITSSATYLFERKELLNEYINDFNRLGPICLQYEANDTITEVLRKKYVPYGIDDKEHYMDLYDRTVECFSDASTIFPVHRFAQLVSNVTDVYYLKFNFRGTYTGSRCNSTVDKALCDEITAKNIVEHCDDLQYLFSADHIPQITDQFSPEGQIVTKYTKLLHSFAKNGYPYFGPDLPASLAKFGTDEKFVKFDASFEVDKHPFKSAALWNSLFPVKN